jgi:hypothetical protein
VSLLLVPAGAVQWQAFVMGTTTPPQPNTQLDELTPSQASDVESTEPEIPDDPDENELDAITPSPELEEPPAKKVKGNKVSLKANVPKGGLAKEINPKDMSKSHCLCGCAVQAYVWV